MEKHFRSSRNEMVKDPELSGLMAGKKGSIPPQQHHHQHHPELGYRAEAYAKGYLNGLREYFIEHGYTAAELTDLIPSFVEPSDLNFLAKGMHKKSPGITEGDPSQGSADVVSRQRQVRMYRLGLSVALNGLARKFEFGELPGDDASYHAFTLDTRVRSHFRSLIF